MRNLNLFRHGVLLDFGTAFTSVQRGQAHRVLEISVAPELGLDGNFGAG